MCRGRGGSRPGAGVKKGSKRGPYTKKAATKKKSKPSNASTAMLAAFVAGGNTNEALHDGHDEGAPAAAAPQLHVDDKSTVRANNGPGANWTLGADTSCSGRDHDHNMGGEGAA